MSYREVAVIGLARAMFGWDSGSLFVLAAGMSPRTEGKLTLLLRAGMSLPLVWEARAGKEHVCSGWRKLATLSQRRVCG
jgi:hypothetical protein